MPHVIDYSWARPAPSAIKAAGYTGVLRYVSHDRTGKNLDAAELKALRAAGLDVTLNFEQSERRPLEGFGAGQADAVFSDQFADNLGYPRYCAIYYSVDFAAAAAQVSEYFRGIASLSKRPVGVYGGLGIITAARAMGYSQYGWVTNAASWSSMRTWSQVRDVAVKDPTRYHLLQHLHSNTPAPIAGVGNDSFDPNTVINPDYGQWKAAAEPKGLFMALTPAQEMQVVSILNDLNGLFFGGIGRGDKKDVSMLHEFRRRFEALPKQIATEIVAQLPAGTVDADHIAEAVVAKLAATLAS